MQGRVLVFNETIALIAVAFAACYLLLCFVWMFQVDVG
jgi:hypothetical protein